MKKLHLLIALASLTFTSAAQAQIFNITFTGGNSAANGQITVVDGIATSGYLDVTGGANQGTYNLVSLTSPLINGESSDNGSIQTLVIPGSDQIFDDVVNAGSNPFLTGNGLEFANNTTSAGFNLWSNGANSYSLFDSSATVYDIDGGTATIAPAATPEPSTYAMLLSGLGLLAVWRLRSRRA